MLKRIDTYCMRYCCFVTALSCVIYGDLQTTGMEDKKDKKNYQSMQHLNV